MKFKKIFVSLFFLISLHFFYNYVGVYKQLHRRPCSVHHWAQCVRASVALNYYQTDMNFFKPKVHRALDGEGITGIEFPFINYSVAILYKLFGFKEIYYRLFVLLTLILGLVCFHYLAYSFTKNYLLSILAVGAAYASPVLIYYSANFLPDTTSVGFVLAAWLFFFKYVKSNRKLHLITFFVLATLAILIKATSVIVFGVVFGLIILDALKFFHKTRNNVPLFPQKILLLVLLFLGSGIIYAWYTYANWLSDHYHADAFLLGSMPLATKQQAIDAWDFIKNHWVKLYYAKETYNLIIGICIAFLLFFKQVSRLLFSITILTFIGSCFFIVLMFLQFKNHDYYFIPLMPSIFLLILTFADLVVRVADNYFPPLKFIMCFVLFFNVKECIRQCKKTYSYRFSNAFFAQNGTFIEYENLEPVLRELGIKPTDLTFSGYDGTYCNSLYLMNQRGWTFDYNASFEVFDWFFKTKNIQYLVLSDSLTFNKTFPNNYAKNIIGHHQNLLIYKLK